MDIQKIEEIFKAIIHDATISRMKSFSSRTDIEIEELDGDSYENVKKWKNQEWAVLIMIFAKALKIQMKVDFDQQSLTAFMIKKSDLQSCMDDPSIRVDFVKEYCNMVAGGIKQTLEKIDEEDLGEEDYKLSVPYQSYKGKSHDEQIPVELQAQTGAVEFMHRWRVSAEGSSIKIAVLSSILDQNKLHQLAKTDINKILITDDGSVEFF